MRSLSVSFFRLAACLPIFALAVCNSHAENSKASAQLNPELLADSVQIEDKNGKCWLVIRRINRGKLGTDSYRSEISAGLYRKQHNTITTIWKLRDFNFNSLETLEYSQNQFRLADIDADGKTDIFLWYVKISDGLDPDSLKLFLYVNGTKYAIRGRIPKLEYDLDLYEKKPDPGNSKASSKIRQSLEKQWDSIATPLLEALKSESQE